MSYDSRPDTYEHIHRVQLFMGQVIANLAQRSWSHDRSKLVEPEVEVFDTFTPKLAESAYDSDEYRQNLAGMGVGLVHHYAENTHHPEHYPDGIRACRCSI